MRHEEALALHRREAGLYEQLLARDPADSEARVGLAVAMMRIAQLQVVAGESAAALPAAERSARLMAALLRFDPANTLWQEIAAKAASGRAEALVQAGDWERAEAVNRLALELAGVLVAADPTVCEWRAESLVPARAVEIAILPAPERAARWKA